MKSRLRFGCALMFAAFGTTAVAGDGYGDPAFGAGAVNRALFGHGFLRSRALATSDGGIVVVGTAYGPGPGPNSPALVRVLAGGDADRNFGTEGFAHLPFVRSDAHYYSGDAFVATAAGQFVVVGVRNNAPVLSLVRFNANGSVDTTFGSGGQALATLGGANEGFNGGVDAAAVGANGKIVVVTRVNAVATAHAAQRMARFNADGTLDTSFHGTGWTTLTFLGDPRDYACCVTVDAQGRTLLAGSSGTPHAQMSVLRLDAAGNPDATFGTAGLVRVGFGAADDAYAAAMTLQPDGKILLAGATNTAGTTDFGVVRLAADGAPDAGFGTDGRVRVAFDLAGSDWRDYATDIALEPDGKILVAGLAALNVRMSGGMWVWPDYRQAEAVTRLLPSGVRDDGFGVAGRTVSGEVEGVEPVLVLRPGRALLVLPTAALDGAETTTAVATIALLDGDGVFRSAFE